MTETYTVTVSSFQEIQDRMQKLGDNAESIIQQSVHDALNGEVRSEIIRRTPLATKERYYYDYNKATKTFKLNKEKRAKTKISIKALRNGLRVDLKGTDEVTITNSVPYAAYVHDAKKPVEGHYWQAGQKGGWTTDGTGNKFIEKPLSDHANDIPEWTVQAIDKRLRKEGII